MSMKLFFICYLALFLITSHPTGFLDQDNIKIKGKVMDQGTKSPLAFATIRILGTDLGVVSNLFGEFEFGFPSSYRSDTLQVSMMGYKHSIQPISNFIDRDYVTIRMEEVVIMLDEVTIQGRQMSAREIVEKVIENIPRNYPSTPYLMEGFTRAHKKQCGKYISLFEATFDLYGKGYNNKPKSGYPEKVYLKESRQSGKVDQYLARQLESNRNPFVAMNHINDVLMLSYSLKTASHQYDLENHISIDNRSVYVILASFPNNDLRHYSHRMFIDAENFALIKSDMKMETIEEGDPNPHLFYGKSTDTTWTQVTTLRKTIQFEEKKGRYFPKYINWAMEGLLLSAETKESFCDWGGRFEMMFTDFSVGDVERPSKKNLLKPRGGKDPPDTPYNPEFWRNFDLIREFPLTEQIVTDLSTTVDLESQFMQRGNKVIKR